MVVVDEPTLLTVCSRVHATCDLLSCGPPLAHGGPTEHVGEPRCGYRRPCRGEVIVAIARTLCLGALPFTAQMLGVAALKGATPCQTKTVDGPCGGHQWVTRPCGGPPQGFPGALVTCTRGLCMAPILTCMGIVHRHIVLDSYILCTFPFNVSTQHISYAQFKLPGGF